MDELQKPSEPQAQFEWVKTKEVPEIYGNFVNVSWSLFDVRFMIGQLIPTGPTMVTDFVVEQRGAVTIAWPEARVLRDMLVDLVARYEKVNGEIKPIKLAPVTL